jgi:PIN domain nuclease of toxin-antitoxin system
MTRATLNLLIDTNVLIWSATEPQRIGQATRSLIADSDQIAVSVVSLWEAGIKHAIGRLSGPRSIEDLVEFALRWDATLIPMDLQDVLVAPRLPRLHDDPFDRMIVAQALNRGLTVLTSDRRIPEYGVPTIRA